MKNGERVQLVTTEKENPQLEIHEFKDIDGDNNIGINVEDYVVFATEQESKRWTLNFALKNELKGSSWMDTLTGKGAFSTMSKLKPAFEKIIQELKKRGLDWYCVCDERRARFYSRYVPKDKIQIVEDKQ